MVDGLKEGHREAIIDILSANRRVERAVLFGSRAMETFTTTSDIDIALFGGHLTLIDKAKLVDALESTSIPQRVDLLLYHRVTDVDLLDHIKQHGIEWYCRDINNTSEWHDAILGDLVNITRGRSYRSAQLQDNEDVALVTLKSFERGGGYRHDGLKPYVGPYKPEQVLAPGEMVVAQTDITQNADVIGRPAIVPDGTPYDTLVASLDAAIVRNIAPSKLDLSYLYYRMFARDYVEHVKNRSTGTTVLHLARDAVPEFELTLPPLPEQRHIAHILGTLDDKIELNRRMNETLDEMARAIFKDWFVDFGPVHAKMEGRAPYLPDHIWKLFPDSLSDSELGQIPDGWEVGTVKDLCVNIQSGGTPRRMSPEYWNGDIPWFKTGELLDGPLLDSEEHITEGGLTSSSCKLWPKGTILVALYASPTVGRLGILERPATSNQACSALMPKAEFGTVFSYYTMLFTRHQLRHIASGSAQQNINQSIVKAHNVVIPQSQVVAQFNQTVMPIYDKIVANMHQTVTLSEMRDTLLPKLVSGEVRVSVDE